MPVSSLADRLVALVDGGTPRVEFGRLTLDVPAAGWVAAATAARDDQGTDLSCFDWLSAVDELDSGFDVVLSVYSATHRHRALLRTRVVENIQQAFDRYLNPGRPAFVPREHRSLPSAKSAVMTWLLQRNTASS